MSSHIRPVVFSGPSGCGKSTLLKKLFDEFKNCFEFSVSHTTRKPRPGEVHGKEYFFVSREEMQKAIENNEFVEHAEFSGNMYGTSKKAIEDIIKSGKICTLDIEMNGVINVKKTNLNARFIFIKPPSLEILESRLRGRGTETEESIQKRLTTAKVEMEFASHEGNYDHTIVNDDLEEAYKHLKEILIEDIKHVQSHQNQH